MSNTGLVLVDCRDSLYWLRDPSLVFRIRLIDCHDYNSQPDFCN